MSRNPINKVLSRFTDVRPEDAPVSWLMFLYFFLITSSAYMIKPVKISLYLEWLNPSKLPYAYLMTAVFIGFFVSLNSRMLHAMRRNVYISFTLVFFIINLILFWFFFQNIQWKWLSMIYWIWADVFTVTSITQFWILVNDIYNPREAKRVIGFLVSGGLLGGIAGSLLASFLARTIGTENLLLICPLMLSFCLVIVNRVHRLFRAEKEKEPSLPKKRKFRYGESFYLIRKSRYLILLCILMAAGIIVTTLIDFQFNSVVKMAFTNRMDSMTSFLGSFFTLLLIFSYLLHILLTRRILSKFGLKTALLIAPCFLLFASLAVFLIPVLIYWAVLIKGADKSLSHSLNQSVRELLYIPISPEVKYKAKIFIDMFISKFAKGLGALLLLLFTSFFQFTITKLSFVVIAVALFWIAIGFLVTREYVNSVKKNLKIKWKDADRLITEKLDVDMTKLVFDTLESRKKSSVLYAMNLFDLFKKKKLSPELKKIISFKADEIKASSMDSLLELDGEKLLPELDDSLEVEDLNTQVKEIMSLNVYQELMKENLKKILAGEGAQHGEVSRMEAAKALGMMDPDSSLVLQLKQFLNDESPEVVRYALESAGKLKKREFVPFVIQHLSNPLHQRFAGKTLVSYGEKITGTLRDYLSDMDEDVRLRKAVPDIMAQVGNQKAADLLLLELKKRGDTEFEVIDALSKMKAEKPWIRFREDTVVTEILLLIKESYLIMIEMHELIDNTDKSEQVHKLENDLTRYLRYIFELLGLVYEQEDIARAYQNICVGTKKAIDYSVELLDNILKKKLKEFLLPLIDDIPFEDKYRRCKKLLKVIEKVDIIT